MSQTEPQFASEKIPQYSSVIESIKYNWITRDLVGYLYGE